MSKEMNSDAYHAPHWPRWLRMAWLFRLFDAARDRWRNCTERARFNERTLPKSAERVLLIRDRGLGDVLQITTLFDAIRKRYAATTLDILTSSRGKQLLASDTRIDNAYLTDSPPPNFAEEYDLVINLHIFDNSPAVKAAVQQVPEEKLLGRTFRPDREEGWYSYLAGSTWMRKYSRLADVPYVEGLPLDICIEHDEAWEEEAEAYLAEIFPDKTPPLAICLGGVDWQRNFSISFLEMLIQTFKDAYPIALVGWQADRPEAEQAELAEMLTRHPSVRDLTKDQPLRELLFTLEYAGALLTSDTGPVHMAIGVGTPVAVLFGHTTGAQLLGPETRSEKHASITPPKGCRFCGYRIREGCSTMRRAECMDRFDRNEIRREVTRLFKK